MRTHCYHTGKFDAKLLESPYGRLEYVIRFAPFYTRDSKSDSKRDLVTEDDLTESEWDSLYNRRASITVDNDSDISNHSGRSIDVDRGGEKNDVKEEIRENRSPFPSLSSSFSLSSPLLMSTILSTSSLPIDMRPSQETGKCRIVALSIHKAIHVLTSDQCR